MKTQRGFVIAILLAPGAAFAHQAGSPSRFDGAYSLRCTQAALTVHLDAAGVFAGVPGELHETLAIPLDCDGLDPEDLEAFSEDIHQRCSSAGLPADRCALLAADLSNSMAELYAAIEAATPQQLTLTAQQTNHLFNQLLGIYPARGAHLFADGTLRSWDYLLNNNQGAHLGELGAFGIHIPAGANAGNLACAAATVAAVHGRVTLPGSVSLDFGVDGSLTCAAADGANWLLVNAGISFSGALEGLRAQPRPEFSFAKLSTLERRQPLRTVVEP